MHAFLVLLAFIASTAVAIGQATVVFMAGRGRITHPYPGVAPWSVGNPSTHQYAGKLNIALYAAPLGTELKMMGRAPDLCGSSGWRRMNNAPISLIGPFPGTVPAVVCSFDPRFIRAGDVVQLIVVAWTGEFSDFDWALRSGASWVGWAGCCENGGAFGWRQKTGIDWPPLPEMLAEGVFDGLIIGPLDWQADFPRGQTAEAGDGFVHLSWVGDWPTWSYDIVRCTMPWGPYELIQSTTHTSYLDTQVTNEITYRYIVYLCGRHCSPWQVMEATPHGPPAARAFLDPAGRGLTVAWPEWGTKYQAYSTTNLANPMWTAVTNSVITNNGSLQLMVTPSKTPGEWFRLNSR